MNASAKKRRVALPLAQVIDFTAYRQTRVGKTCNTCANWWAPFIARSAGSLPSECHSDDAETHKLSKLWPDTPASYSCRWWQSQEDDK